jgi:ABC-type phosphate transport system substrate-binding protein
MGRAFDALLLLVCIFIMNGQKGGLQVYSSSFMSPVVRTLSKEYSDDPATPNYAELTTVSSTIALDRLKASNMSTDPNYVDIAVSEFPTTPLVCFPVNTAALAVIYNFGDSALVTPLIVTIPILLGIYNGTISFWNDTLIQASNPTITLPTGRIQMLYRTDASGSNYAISRIFSQYSSAYNAAYGMSTFPKYPVQIPYFIPNSLTLIHYADQILNSLAIISLGVYRDPNSLISRRIRLASVKGDYNTGPIVPSVSSVNLAILNSASAKNSTFANVTRGDLPPPELFDVANVNFPTAYPLVIYTYGCVNGIQTDERRGSIVVQFVSFWNNYAATSLPYDYGGLPPVVQAISKDIYRTKIRCGLIACRTYVPVDIFPAWAITLIILSLGFIMFMCVAIILTLTAFAWRKLFRKKKRYSLLSDPLLANEVSLELSSNDRTRILYEDLTLEEQIGSGSFSEVYKGKWLGTSVAIKRMLVTKRDDSSDPIGDFVKETSIMNTMRHPNIVQYLGATVKSPHLYIITEFCDKGDMQTILRDKDIKLTVTKTAEMALDAAKGMVYLHSSKPPILHRDLKSANLFVDKNWTVKVGDFGLSRVLDSREMTVCGTAETCAPEVLSKNSYTEKADVFSFGIVLWEMLTREPLYPGMNFFELSSQVVNAGLRPNLTDHTFPEELSDLMQRCWDNEPTKRPGFDEVVDILNHFLENRKGKLKKKKESVLFPDL